MNIFIAIAIMFVVILVVGMIFDWFTDITGLIIFTIVGSVVTGFLLAAAVSAIKEKAKPDPVPVSVCKVTHTC